MGVDGRARGLGRGFVFFVLLLGRFFVSGLEGAPPSPEDGSFVRIPERPPEQGEPAPDFRVLIPELQPVLLYDGNRYRGIFRFFDGEETVPALNLFFDQDENVGNNVARFYSLFTEGQLWGTLAGAEGAVYYQSLRVDLDALPYLVHQFWYYFVVGDGPGGAYHNGFSLAELYQRIDPGLAELAAWRTELLAELRGHRETLAALSSPTEQEKTMARRLDELIARGDRLELPLHSHVRKVATAGPMVMGGVVPPLTVRVYDHRQVEWMENRPKLYVTRGLHSLVCRREDLGDEECDPPYRTHPGLREVLINLHDPRAKANPVPGGRNRYGVDFKGQFVQHPIFRQGIIRWSRNREP